MVYKSKKEYYQAVIQFLGDCLMNGMPKGQAVAATQEQFSIASHDTVYKIVRRVIRRHEEQQVREGQQDGK